MRLASLPAALCGLALLAAPAAAQNLIVTGVFDGPLAGGLPKVVELYVVADIADLSRYAAGAANNGGGSDGAESVLPAGPATAGSFITISADLDSFVSYFGTQPTFVDGATNSAAGINGDDAVELFFDANADGAFTADEVVDVFGEIAVDGTGRPWEYLDGWAYRANATGPDGSTFVAANWTFSGINVNDNQTTNAGSPAPWPLGTYQRGPVATEGRPDAGAALAVATPARAGAAVRLTLAAPAEGALALYDALGRRVGVLAAGALGTDVRAALPAGLAPGVYVLRAEAGAVALSRAVVVVR